MSIPLRYEKTQFRRHILAKKLAIKVFKEPLKWKHAVSLIGIDSPANLAKGGYVQDKDQRLFSTDTAMFLSKQVPFH